MRPTMADMHAELTRLVPDARAPFAELHGHPDRPVEATG
jgi:hypothetical protein